MSFASEFEAERRRLAPLFAVAADADKTFHAAWDEGVANLGVSRYKQTEQYARTLDHFHASRNAIDRIVSNALADAKQGRYGQFAMLFAYLDIPGRYFRSGYQRTEIWRLLKQLPLDEAQSAILRRIILHQVETAGPEFKDATKVAPSVSSPDFYREVQQLCESDRDYVSRRADRLLMYIDSAAT